MKALLGVLIAALAVGAVGAAAEKSKTVYVQFILGTDQACSETTCHEIGPKLSKKLSPVFRWKHYWELDRKKVSVPASQSKHVDLPQSRKLDMTFTRSGELEVRLTRRSGLVTKTQFKLDGPMVVLGGEDEARQSIFVVVRSDEPTTE